MSSARRCATSCSGEAVSSPPGRPAGTTSGGTRGRTSLWPTCSPLPAVGPVTARTQRRAEDPRRAGERHPVLAGFDGTDILPFAGRLEFVRTDPEAQTLATLVPPFPIYPPETAWMRHPDSGVTALVLHEPPTGGRVAYLPADVDRCFGHDNHPDHADLLANVVRWAAQEPPPLSVEGTGLVDCHLYRQADRLVLHLVNLTSAGTWRAPLHELIPVGPFRVQLRPDAADASVRLLVADTDVPAAVENGVVTFEVPAVADHEVAVVTLL